MLQSHKPHTPELYYELTVMLSEGRGSATTETETSHQFEYRTAASDDGSRCGMTKTDQKSNGFANTRFFD